MSIVSEPQQRFDENYITASEIAKDVGVARVTVHYARKNGILPNPIVVGDNLVCIWERKPLEEHLKNWKLQMAAKRGEIE